MYDENGNPTDEQQQHIPDGTYRGRATDAQLGETNGGAEQIAIAFALTQPGFEQHRLAYYGTFGEKALPHTLKAMRACGWTGVDLSDLSGIDANEVDLVVVNETFEGKTRAKIKWVNVPGVGLLKKQLDPAAQASFASRMRGAIAAFDQANRAPAAAPARPAQQAQRPAQQPRPAAPPQQQQRSFGRPPEPPPHTDADALPF